MSKELDKFKKSFEDSTGILVDTLEESHIPHWKRLVFYNSSLNRLDILNVSLYISETFSEKGTYSDLLPKLGVYKNQLVLTVGINQIKEFINRNIKP